MKKSRTLENRLAMLVCLTTAVPGVCVLFCLWLLEASVYVTGVAAIMLVSLVLYATLHVRNSVDYQFRSLQNLLEAVSAGDYSLRLSTGNRQGALHEVVSTVNTLVATLQEQKQRAEEHQLLLDKVIEQMDVAIVAWDGDGKTSFMNPAANSLFAGLGKTGVVSPLAMLLADMETLPLRKAEVRTLPIGDGIDRYRLYRDQYFVGGFTFSLLFITNVDTLLKREEKRAWQNLIRVISHEINNSLVPLASMSDTMRGQVRKREQDVQLAAELEAGLSLVKNRSEGLSQFLERYRLISNLSKPVPTSVSLPEKLSGLSRLFSGVEITLHGEPLTFSADAAQFEQLMINLIKNAVEAMETVTAQPPGNAQAIEISWENEGSDICLSIKDNGMGVHNPDNLFVPLYSTKQQGQGIGLVLCREIVAAHGGTITLKNRQHQQGCEVLVRMPRQEPPA